VHLKELNASFRFPVPIVLRSLLMDGGVEAVSEKVSLGHHLVSTEKKKPDKHLYSHHGLVRIIVLSAACTR
jgi:hypothetical protein